MDIQPKIVLPDTDEKLLDQCKVETYRSSGPGGQHVNTTDSAVRITYLPLNLTVTCQKERSQLLNKLTCIKKLRKKVEQLNYRAPKRIATKIPWHKKEKGLQKKLEHGAKKRLRRKPDLNE